MLSIEHLHGGMGLAVDDDCFRSVAACFCACGVGDTGLRASLLELAAPTQTRWLIGVVYRRMIVLCKRKSF